QLKASLSAANVSQWTDALPLVLLGIRNAVKADIGYTAAQLVYGTTLRLQGEFVDPSSSSMSMDLTSYTNRLTNAMRSVKPASTRPQSTDVFVQPDLRYSTHVFVRRDSHRISIRRTFQSTSTRTEVIDKNGTNDSISIDRLKAAYLEGNPIYVDFPSLQLNDTTPTLIIPHPTTNTHDDTSTASENKLKTTRSGRRMSTLDRKAELEMKKARLAILRENRMKREKVKIDGTNGGTQNNLKNYGSAQGLRTETEELLRTLGIPVSDEPLSQVSNDRILSKLTSHPPQ
ncbi:unnamed protein product, partial [Schistosoma margrebowiei]